MEVVARPLGHPTSVIHRRDPATAPRGGFWLLGFPPGPVRPSLDDLAATALRHDRHIDAVLSADARSTCTHAARYSRPRPLPPPGFQATGLQARATTPSRLTTLPPLHTTPFKHPTPFTQSSHLLSLSLHSQTHALTHSRTHALTLSVTHAIFACRRRRRLRSLCTSYSLPHTLARTLAQPLLRHPHLTIASPFAFPSLPTPPPPPNCNRQSSCANINHHICSFRIESWPAIRCKLTRLAATFTGTRL